MAEELNGSVSKIIFKANDGYTVALINGVEETVAVGAMPDLKIGESVRLMGEYGTHYKYGRQFAVTSVVRSLPCETDGAVLFLASGFIKGLGPVLAKRIVDKFKGDTFNVLENQPERLTEVKGVSKKLAGSIQKALSEYADKKYAYSELMGLGLTARQAALAEGALGSDAASQVRENPYILIPNVYGIDFITADIIAKKLGTDPKSPSRIRYGVLNVLKKVLDQGDMYVMKDQLICHVAEKLGVEEDDVYTALMDMTRDNSIVIRRYAKDFELVFTAHSYNAEAEVAARLLKMNASPLQIQAYDLNGQLKRQEWRLNLTDEQKASIVTAAESSVCVLTGGPGTGKTTILDALLHILGASGITYALAAPTGRAAKRMQTATGAEAKTIHRLLEYAYDEDAYQCYFKRCEENPLDYDAIIVDEVSMLDTFLMRNLLRAIKPGARLLLVGDADQLPSVGPGNVMRDILNSGVIRHVRLTHRFRNAGKIADAAHDMLNGVYPTFDDKEFIFISCQSNAEVVNAVTHEYGALARAGADVQVIAPVKKTDVGSIALNIALRETVNPPALDKPELIFGEKLFRKGDRVMQIKNNYARAWKNHDDLTEGEGVFNGDIGVITEVLQQRLCVRFEDGKHSEYADAEIGELDAAFAYTIHKSQGSEFDVVIIPVMQAQNPIFFTRNLLYTGITRAKKAVIIVGNPAAIKFMVKNNTRTTRKTALSKELKRYSRIFEGQEIV